MSTTLGGGYAIDPLHDSRWPDFVDRHPKGSVFHTRGWLRALQETYGYDPVAFTTSAHSEKLTNALLFCVVRSRITGNRLVSLPLSDHCEPLVEQPEQFTILSSCVEKMRNQERWKYVELRSADSLLNVGENFSKVTTYCLHRLDLRQGLDRLYQGFHKNCIQRKISRAQREELSYQAGRSGDLLHQFYGLLQLTRSRHHLPPPPIEWFRNLVFCLGENVCIRIASKAGQPVAGILTLRHGKSMVYKYGGSDTRFNNLGGTAMLFWEAIKDAKQAAAEIFDWGRSDLDNPGLIAFKGRWSAERSTLSTWRAPLETASRCRDDLKIRCAKEVFARMPNSLLTLAGRLLYRHIG
ncbi:MAG: GNAT family N-acetyltransferase [Nitrospira sp.]|nr:MAG: GNAT family N-acetyltransferase [Nitrospira sp.]